MARIRRIISALIWTTVRYIGLPTRAASSPRLALGTWLNELQGVLTTQIRGRIAILAVRNPTWIEWAVYMACWMRKLGYGPVILFSGREIHRVFGGPKQQTFLQRLLFGDYWKQVSNIPDVKLIDLDIEPRPEASVVSSYQEFSRDYAHTMAAYDLRVEEHEEGDHHEAYLAEAAKDEDILAEYAAMMEGVFRRLGRQDGVRRIIAYSGLIGVTSAVGAVAAQCGWDVIFCEGWIKPGHMILNLNAPSLVYDIESWLKTLGEWDEEQDKDIGKFLAFQETNELDENGVWFKNYRTSQRSSVDADLDKDLKTFLQADGPLFMLTPNCVGDSSTLRVQTIFRSQREWVREVCRYFQAHPEWRLVIRAHPDELLYFQINKIVIMMGDIAEKAAGNAPNIRVIKGNEDISTYSLIPYAQAGLVWMSNVGVDMAVRNCPVLAAAKPKYHGLGIVYEPRTREEYFDTLEKLAVSPRGTSEQQKEMGKKYLTILAKEFSYEAFGPDHRGRNILLNSHGRGGDAETFYKILAGELPPCSRPADRNRSMGQ